MEESKMSKGEQVRRLRRQAKSFAMKLDWSFAEENYVRASGDALCEVCGLPNYDHPYREDVHLYVDCRGNFLHL